MNKLLTKFLKSCSEVLLLGRRIKKLEELYGIQNGGDRKSEKISSANGGTDNEKPHTQEELAAMLDMSVDTLDRAKKLASLPLEIQELVKVSAPACSMGSKFD